MGIEELVFLLGLYYLIGLKVNYRIKFMMDGQKEFLKVYINYYYFNVYQIN